MESQASSYRSYNLLRDDRSVLLFSHEVELEARRSRSFNYQNP